MSDVRIIRDGDARLVRIIGDGDARLVRVIAEGPQGPAGPAGVASLAEMIDVDVAAAANRSTLVYDTTLGKWVGSPYTTVDEILNGGNF